jgi:hypothetical protein
MWVRLFEDFDQHLQNHRLYYFSFSFPAQRLGLYIIIVQEIFGRYPQFAEILILWYIPVITPAWGGHTLVIALPSPLLIA